MALLDRQTATIVLLNDSHLFVPVAVGLSSTVGISVQDLPTVQGQLAVGRAPFFTRKIYCGLLPLGQLQRLMVRLYLQVQL